MLLPVASSDQLEELLTLLMGDVRLVDAHGHEIELGADVAEAFQATVAGMLTHEASDLTTQEAAKLIGVSRPTLIRLLEMGVLPYRRTNGDRGHRRISRRDALDYLRADLVRRRHALDALAADAEAFGFFED
jgi:excisionase family DNA binding protein